MTSFSRIAWVRGRNASLLVKTHCLAAKVLSSITPVRQRKREKGISDKTVMFWSLIIKIPLVKKEIWSRRGANTQEESSHGYLLNAVTIGLGLGSCVTRARYTCGISRAAGAMSPDQWRRQTDSNCPDKQFQCWDHTASAALFFYFLL